MEMLKSAFRRTPLAPPYYWFRNKRRYAEFGPPLHWVRFGGLRRVRPVSAEHQRGISIDRYYVHRFLETHVSDIRGHVLEVAEDLYTSRYGGDRVTRSTVLHRQTGNPKATIVADLSSAPQIESDSFDCIILTQVLQYIPDMRAALGTIHRILKPGGVLLATVPGLSQVWSEPNVSWRELWRMTADGARHLFAEQFPDAEITPQGNVLAATAFLHGLAIEELRPQELEFFDPHYPIVVLVRAVKPIDERSKPAERSSSTNVAGMLVEMLPAEADAEWFSAQESAMHASLIVENSSFERGLTGWGTGFFEAAFPLEGPLKRPLAINGARAAWSVTSGRAKTGALSLRVEHTTAAAPDVYSMLSQRIKVKPRTAYKIGFWFLAEASDPQGSFSLAFLPSRLASPDEWERRKIKIGEQTAGQWAMYSSTVDTGEDTYFDLRFLAASPLAGWVDDVFVEEQPC